MKRMLKLVLVAVPALLIAATVGLTTMGCGDDTSSPADMAQDMSMHTDGPVHLDGGADAGH